MKLIYFWNDAFKEMRDMFVESIKDDFQLEEHYLDAEAIKSRYAWDSQGFGGGMPIWLFKTDLIIDSIIKNAGSTIVVSDIDIVFFKPVIPELKQLIKSFDTLFQKEFLNRPDKPVNIGFMVIQCNDKTLKFWRAVRQMLTDTGTWDQQCVWNILNSRNQIIKYDLLPNSFYNKTLQTNVPIPKSPFLYHANFSAGGLDEKISNIKTFQTLVSYSQTCNNKIALVLRGHIRDSFKSDRLALFCDAIQNFTDLDVYVTTWNKEKSNLGWADSTNSFSKTIRPIDVARYFEPMKLKDVCLVDEDAVFLSGNIAGTASNSKRCKRIAQKLYWAINNISISKIPNIYSYKFIVACRLDILSSRLVNLCHDTSLGYNTFYEVGSKIYPIDFIKQLLIEDSVRPLNSDLSANQIYSLYPIVGCDNMFAGSERVMRTLHTDMSQKYDYYEKSMLRRIHKQNTTHELVFRHCCDLEYRFNYFVKDDDNQICKFSGIKLT